MKVRAKVMMFAAVLAALPSGPAAGALSDCIDATCRVTAPDGGRGSGCVFERSQGQVYVLTAAHVVGDARGVQCEFWRQGHQSAPLAGEVVLRAADGEVDAAVIAVAEWQFGGVLPAAIPIAPRDFRVRPGQTLTSVGCAGGAWSTGWKGHALGYEGGDLLFLPTPAQGRSGSALFDAEGRQIVGIVRARTLDNDHGIACSVQSLYGRLCRLAAERQVQCGPNGCPTPQYRLLPYRQQQENRQGSGASPWPTLPSGPDLGETNRRLDAIADLLLQMRPAATAAGGAVEDRAAAAEKTAKEAQATADQVRQEQSRLQETLGKVRGVLEQLTGDVTTLPERFQARIDKVKAQGAQGTDDIAQAYLRDLLAEKLGEGKGLTIGKLLTGALGLSGPLAIALIVGLGFLGNRIHQKVQAGEPLLVQQLLTRIHDKVDDLRTRAGHDRPAP